MLETAVSTVLDKSVNRILLTNGEVVCDDSERIPLQLVMPILADLPVPDSLKLKEPSEFQVIGNPQRSIGVEKKVNGTLGYGMDVKVPGAMTAVVAHPPSFGAQITHFDSSTALAIPGVLEVLRIPTGIAVIGENYWVADSGKKALDIDWDESAGQNLSTEGIIETY